MSTFKQRIKVYEKALHPKALPDFDNNNSLMETQPNVIDRFLKEEERISSMMDSYFQLFSDP